MTLIAGPIDCPAVSLYGPKGLSPSGEDTPHALSGKCRIVERGLGFSPESPGGESGSPGAAPGLHVPGVQESESGSPAEASIGLSTGLSE
eukprot:CAMPEP_0180105396 /NCGR_PEP_ID=MMETSP0985-20121206/32054_1 /TAXON_ID=483367 /ORGANISM="non described non described, Strain CCMP 2436" /LENGTH=89 /DNA_ID=CAMNT_0022042485 /DNA_START=56 /DNA_END=325 /DNA_ORIENTATION=+